MCNTQSASFTSASPPHNMDYFAAFAACVLLLMFLTQARVLRLQTLREQQHLRFIERAVRSPASRALCAELPGGCGVVVFSNAHVRRDVPARRRALADSMREQQRVHGLPMLVQGASCSTVRSVLMASASDSHSGTSTGSTPPAPPAAAPASARSC